MFPVLYKLPAQEVYSFIGLIQMKRLELNNIKKVMFKLLIMRFDFPKFLGIIIASSKEKSTAYKLDLMQ